MKECKECHGTGYLTTMCDCWADLNCHKCHGTGEFQSIYDDCPKCHGTGRVSTISLDFKKLNKDARAIFSITVFCPCVDLIFGIEIFGYAFQIVKG